jgi:hypothetical protein
MMEDNLGIHEPLGVVAHYFRKGCYICWVKEKVWAVNLLFNFFCRLQSFLNPLLVSNMLNRYKLFLMD